jgi:hypothetical protein
MINCMKINILEINIIYFSRNTYTPHVNYYSDDILIRLIDCVKDFGVMLDSKLYSHRNIDGVYCNVLKLREITRFVTYNVSSLDSLIV